MKEIPNDKLKPYDIPDPDGDLNEWFDFAHTINGYEEAGSFKACAELANEQSAKTLTEMRCALLFEARRDRHSGGMGYIDTDWIRKLLRGIKEMVEAQGNL
ncbi:hypothetical protein [Cyanobium sp. NIES-981]|uniref:hypothetical protein n=1 Tax=Cyanobium sp. NIES-981 TaxID=1851505 RepID=UPI0007DD54D7|nr:hypothetical protein [Cyanobium sp. NIES-981]SBO42643.1 conserved protein of unknown function [Cyanobium sp. NIES-981]